MTLEILLAAVTEAVFGYLIEKTDPVHQVRAWLGRDPARLAFQNALINAYTTFAHKHPQWAQSLFDETFLTRKDVAAELAGLLTRDEEPDPERIVETWVTYFQSPGGDDHEEYARQLLQAVSEFLEDLEAELKRQAELRPIFDSRALDSIEANTATTSEEVEALRAELRQSMDKLGEAGITVEGDVSDSLLVAGDHNVINQTIIRTDPELSDYAHNDFSREIQKSLSARIEQLERIIQANLDSPDARARHAFETSDMPAPDSAPLQPAVYTPRKRLVDELKDILSRSTWLALTGGTGQGKTQIARALADAYEQEYVWWISLRDQKEQNASRHLEQQLVRWLIHVTTEEQHWNQYAGGQIEFQYLAELMADTVRRQGLLVIDNLLDPVDGEDFYHRVAALATVFSKYAVKLVTTSQRSLPPFVELQLGSVVSSFQPPAFDQRDLQDLLKRAQAPSRFRRENIVSFILGVTKGHPSLVAATAHWFQKQDWSLNKDEFEALLRGDPIEGIREHESRRTLRLLDKHHRRLLYRLSLLHGNFDKELAVSVATVSPTIQHPTDALNELVGPWIDRLENSKFEVNPLYKDTGKDNLGQELQEQIHRVAANHYLSGGTIYVPKALDITSHLWNARDFSGFATLLIQLLTSAETPAQAKSVEWATWPLSPDSDWPEELELSTKIMLRAAQVRARILADGDATSLDADLNRLVDEANASEAAAVLVAAWTGITVLESVSPIAVLHRAIKAIRLMRNSAFAEEIDQFVDGSLPGRLEDIVWIPTAYIGTLEEAEVFVTEIGRMTERERIQIYASDLALESTSLLINRIWWREADKDEANQDWNRINQFFDKAQAVGMLPGALPIRIAAVRAKAIVFADYLGRSTDAIELLDSISVPLSPPLGALVSYTKGCILFETEHIRDAIASLEDAASSFQCDFSSYRFDAIRRIAIAQARAGNWGAARSYCIRSIRLASQIDESLRYERLEMLGELAFIHWNTGNQRKASAALYGVVRELVDEGDLTNPRYREVFNKTGHSLGWYMSIVTTGQAPPFTKTGDIYAPVEAGTFGIRRKKLGEYEPEIGFSKQMLLIQLGLLASNVGLPRTAFRVFKHASVDSNSEEQTHPWWETKEIELAPLAARFGEPSEAIQWGLQVARTLATTEKVYQTVKDDSEYPPVLVDKLKQDINVDTIWEGLSKQEREQREKHWLGYTVFGPAFAAMLGDYLAEGKLEAKLSQWERAVSAHRDSFEDAGYWSTVLAIFRKRILLDSQSFTQEEHAILEEDTVLKVLWYMTSVENKDVKLIEMCQRQFAALNSLLDSHHFTKHMADGIGKYMHRVWTNIAATRGFALYSPQLFRQELREIPSDQGISTAVRTLLGACHAVGLSVPDELLKKFRKFE